MVEMKLVIQCKLTHNKLFYRVAIENDRTETYLNAIRSEVQRDMPQIVVAVVPSNRKDRYDAIKKLCCLEMPGKYQ